MRAMDQDLLLSLQALTDAGRIQVLGRLITGPATASGLAADAGLSPAAARHALERLVTAGFAERRGTGPQTTYAFRPATLHRIARDLAVAAATAAGVEASGPGTGPAGETLPAEVARILRGFFEDDRLVTIPANGAKRAVVLAYLRDRCFSEDRAYPEKEVNQRLATFHPDVAALRRYMVDGGLMTRADGRYHRPTTVPDRG